MIGVSQDSHSLLQEQIGVMLLIDSEKQNNEARERKSNRHEKSQKHWIKQKYDSTL